jgi:hypothetical protein
VLALSDLGEARVAIDAAFVEGIASLTGHAVDVARYLGLRVPSSDARRVAVLSTAPGAVLLGAIVKIVELPSDAVRPVPAFVAEHLRLLAIDRIVALDDGFAYLVSPQRLPRQ